jgi:hypothetical protein
MAKRSSNIEIVHNHGLEMLEDALGSIIEGKFQAIVLPADRRDDIKVYAPKHEPFGINDIEKCVKSNNAYVYSDSNPEFVIYGGSDAEENGKPLNDRAWNLFRLAIHGDVLLIRRGSIKLENGGEYSTRKKLGFDSAHD